MSKGNRKYIIILAVCFIALISIQLLAPKPINWTASYIKKDKIPYGTKALYEALPELFSGQRISDANMPAYNSLGADDFEHTNYIIINNLFATDTLDMRELFRFVKKRQQCVYRRQLFHRKICRFLKN